MTKPADSRTDVSPPVAGHRDEPIFIALGTNLGDRAANLFEAARLLETLAGIEIRDRSDIYETAPERPADGGPFLNAVVSVRSDHNPIALLGLLKDIERRMGRRDDSPSRGPRPIDCDLLACGNTVLDSPTLTLPHPRAHCRPFVLLPWSRIAPDFRHPRMRQSIGELWAELKQRPEHAGSIINNLGAWSELTLQAPTP